MFNVVQLSVTRNNGTEHINVLNDINFSIDGGKIYTILGRNGSGKTTLVKSLTNLLNEDTFYTSGKVLWQNKNLLSINITELQQIRKNKIRYVFQDLTNNFDPLKRIKYYFDKSDIDKDYISEQLKSFLLPEYNIISKLHPYEISGGMAQRLSLMLSLLPNPELLVLDEPTSAIDYTNINLVNLKLKDFCSSNNSALVVTQDISFAKTISNEIAFLHDGKLSRFKLPEEFFNPLNNSVESSFIKSYEEMK
jgi:ABC-type glutathione transport system ATPase component